ncbi:hypothetical protein FA95DRAFT_1575808, partial [Auriscalpium vulgare]
MDVAHLRRRHRCQASAVARRCRLVGVCTSAKLPSEDQTRQPPFPAPHFRAGPDPPIIRLCRHRYRQFTLVDGLPPPLQGTLVSGVVLMFLIPDDVLLMRRAPMVSQAWVASSCLNFRAKPSSLELGQQCGLFQTVGRNYEDSEQRAASRSNGVFPVMEYLDVRLK